MVMNKTFRNIVLALFLFYVLPLGANKHKVSYAKLVNTMIGTKGTGWASGYTYPGATYPFGMVQFTRSYFCPHLGFGINQLSGAGCDHIAFGHLARKRKCRLLSSLC